MPNSHERSCTYRKLNAFTAGKSSGNPAACLFLEPGETLSEAEMLAVAREHKGFVSEVIYCTPLGGSRFRLRYFSSECEVEFCGHGTEAIAVALGIAPERIDAQFPVARIDAGLRTLLVPILRLPDVLGLKPDEAALKAFCLKNGIDIVLVFTPDVADRKNRMRTRVFAPKFGYLEDPATGSGNSALGHYLLSRGLWAGEPVTIEQNGERDDHNLVHLKTQGRKVLFGGNARLRIEGVYRL
jgi:predicted PhzF superfamily epimerase YddE/YHI9